MFLFFSQVCAAVRFRESEVKLTGFGVDVGFETVGGDLWVGSGSGCYQ